MAADPLFLFWRAWTIFTRHFVLNDSLVIQDKNIICIEHTLSTKSQGGQQLNS